MGYTHYWTFRKPAKGRTAEAETQYQKAIDACKVIARRWNMQYEGGDERRLSGYTAHTNAYGGVCINGSKDEACEDFVLREHYGQNEQGNFCKTNARCYDDVVTACLSVLKYYLGNLVEVSTDGDAQDWAEGTEFASKCIRRKVTNPIQAREAK